MPDGDRGNRTEVIAAASLCALAVFGVLILAYALGNLNGREAKSRDQTPASYSQAAKADANRSCIGRQSAALFECVYERVEASQEQARGEHDLSAQQRAASAALAAAVVAFLTLTVTGIGVWFVKRTLDATLEAVRDTSIATKAMERQNELAASAQRPWLDFSAVILDAIDFADHAVYIQVTAFNLSNFPAHEVRVSARGNFHAGGIMGAMDATDHRPAIEAELIRLRIGGTAFPREPFSSKTFAVFDDPQEALAKSQSPPARLMVGIRYKFDGGYGYTFKVFKLFGVNEFIEAAKNPPRDVLGKVRALQVKMEVDPATVIAT